MRKKLTAFLVVFILLASAVPALAEPMDVEIVTDVLIARPCGLASIVLGSVLFIVSLPVAVPSGSVKTVGRKLVLDPIEFTFIRPLGDSNYRLGTWPSNKDSEQ